MFSYVPTNVLYVIVRSNDREASACCIDLPVVQIYNTIIVPYIIIVAHSIRCEIHLAKLCSINIMLSPVWLATCCNLQLVRPYLLNACLLFIFSSHAYCLLAQGRASHRADFSLPLPPSRPPTSLPTLVWPLAPSVLFNGKY